MNSNTNPCSLKGKTIIITGASSGIGKQCAIKFNEMGAKCLLIARNKEKLSKLVEELGKKNNQYYAQDISEEFSIDTIFDDFVIKFGKISGFVHSAGLELTKPLKYFEREDFLKLYNLNVYSGFNFIKSISKKKYLDPLGASYVFISSIRAVLGLPGQAAYCASKGAITPLVKSLAQELATKNIRVNAILPTLVEDSNMVQSLSESLTLDQITQSKNNHPLGWISTEDVANACLFLLSDLSKKITGTNLIVDGGYSSK